MTTLGVTDRASRRDGGAFRTPHRRVPVPPEPGTTVLAAEGVSVELGGHRVLHGVDLEVAAGEVVALVGPNGAGKSTLLGAVCGDLPLTGGTVQVDGQPLSSWHARDLAMRRAMLLQQATLSFPFTVTEVVRMGRAPWRGTDAERTDDEVVAAALAAVDVTELARRRFTALSGGERARVALARVLAQRTTTLLLDEPTAALDLHHQELVLRLARAHARDGGAVVLVLHDLALAAAHADRVALLDRGRLRADGAPAEVCTAERLSDVYRHPIDVLPHPTTGELLIVPRRGGPLP